ncbi:hypothetical protein P3L10_032759 [Capsicum annuum]
MCIKVKLKILCKCLSYICISWPIMTVVLTCALLVKLPKVYSVRYIVGSRFGWTTINKVNYTNRVKGKYFYRGDSLCMFWIYSFLRL